LRLPPTALVVGGKQPPVGDDLDVAVDHAESRLGYYAAFQLDPERSNALVNNANRDGPG
jgi:hypothetical protein